MERVLKISNVIEIWQNPEIEYLTNKISYANEYAIVITGNKTSSTVSETFSILQHHNFSTTLSSVGVSVEQDYQVSQPLGFNEITIKGRLDLPENMYVSSLVFLPAIKLQTTSYIDMTITDFIQISYSPKRSGSYLLDGTNTGSLSLRQFTPYPYSSILSDSSMYSTLSQSSFASNFSLEGALIQKFKTLVYQSLLTDTVSGDATNILTFTAIVRSPQLIEVVVLPGIWQRSKTVLIRLIFYFIPLYIAANWVLLKTIQSGVFASETRSLINVPLRYMKAIMQEMIK